MVGFPQLIKDLPAMQETLFNSWVAKIPWRRDRLPTPVFLPGESHAQRSLASYSPWGSKESDVTEQLGIAQHGLWQPRLGCLQLAWLLYIHHRVAQRTHATKAPDCLVFSEEKWLQFPSPKGFMQLSCRFKATSVLRYLSDETLNFRLFDSLLAGQGRYRKNIPKSHRTCYPSLC